MVKNDCKHRGWTLRLVQGELGRDSGLNSLQVTVAEQV